jgi:integrase
VSLGGDPQGDKAARRAQAGRTFGVAVEHYLTAKAAAVRPATLRGIRLYLTGPYFKPLRGAPLAEISRADIAARLNTIARDNSPTAALAARRALSAFFSWSMQEGFLEANPVVGTRRPPAAPSRDRVLSDTELAAVWHHAGDDDYGRILRLLILLGSRRSEIGDMKWEEIDRAAGIWTLPAARSKNHRPHTLPLPPPALEIIKATPHNGREFLFGERGASGFATWSRHKHALDERLGGKVQSWTVHDLRRTVATRLGDIGIEPHIIEEILHHYDGHRAGTAGIYNRSAYLTAVKTALTRWSDYVAALAEGRKSNILPLKHA